MSATSNSTANPLPNTANNTAAANNARISLADTAADLIMAASTGLDKLSNYMVMAVKVGSARGTVDPGLLGVINMQITRQRQFIEEAEKVNSEMERALQAITQ